MQEDSVILFLDDNENRAALMFQRMVEKDKGRTFWTKTVKETLDILENYRDRLDLVSLDHDLGGETFVHTAREDCGMEIVRFLEKKHSKDYAHIRFIIHTWNIPAGKKMTARLRDCGYRVIQTPFGTTDYA